MVIRFIIIFIINFMIIVHYQAKIPIVAEINNLIAFIIFDNTNIAKKTIGRII